MCFTIKESILSDLGPALQLDRESFDKDAWTILDYIGVFSDPGIRRFTARVDGRFAGFGASEMDHEENAVCLLTLAVCPEYRKRGIGTALLKQMEEAFGRSDSYLYVDEANTDAIRLYQKTGYHPTGTIREYYMNGHDAVVMVKYAAADESGVQGDLPRN